jgi:hypothetical protein
MGNIEIGSETLAKRTKTSEKKRKRKRKKHSEKKHKVKNRTDEKNMKVTCSFQSLDPLVAIMK